MTSVQIEWIETELLTVTQTLWHSLATIIPQEPVDMDCFLQYGESFA